MLHLLNECPELWSMLGDGSRRSKLERYVDITLPTPGATIVVLTRGKTAASHSRAFNPVFET